MANKEQLAILKSGVENWNRWRVEHPEIPIDLEDVKLSGCNLRRVNFNYANLRRAIFVGAELSNAQFFHAGLVDANLSKANLQETAFSQAKLVGADLSDSNLTNANLGVVDFYRSKLRGANLYQASLYGTNFTYTQLAETNFQASVLGGTIISDVDLSEARNLAETKHEVSSHIDISTIYKSKGKIPHKFLREAGVPENFITYMASLTGKAFEYFSCFISYTEVDDVISKRLYEGLQASGLRVWRWREDAKWGAPIEKNIDQAVRIYDKLIVICSKDSLKAPAVINEIERALQKEDALMKDGKVPEVLFPITIDDYIFDEWDHYLKPKVIAKTVADFRSWEDPKEYDKVLERLIKALRQEEG